MTTARARINSLTTYFPFFYCFAHFRIKKDDSFSKNNRVYFTETM